MFPGLSYPFIMQCRFAEGILGASKVLEGSTHVYVLIASATDILEGFVDSIYPASFHLLPISPLAHVVL